MFQIKLNKQIVQNLRDTINEQQEISYEKEYKYFKNKGNPKKFRAWDKICAIMDRLEDTIEYLNELELNTEKYSKSAFDFYDFMNNASVIVDCIKELANIFEVEDNEIKSSTDIFNQLGNDRKGTDEKYFEYLRSLCSVHPIETSRHKRYQNNDFECSPYVLWKNNIIPYNDNFDLYVIVYTSKDNEGSKKIGIDIFQIFKYVETRVNFISKIIKTIEKYQNDVIETFKNTKIKKENQFKNYIGATCC